MNPENKKISQEIWQSIQKAKRILLHCHANTDGDSVGSALAMAQALRSMGKEATIIAGDNAPMPGYLSFLPGFDTIVPKDFFQVNLADFDLFIVLDSAAPGQISRKATIAFPLSIPTIIIDHHVSNTRFAGINLVDTSSPATCQILHGLFVEWGIVIDHDIALCLFIGIYTDTGGFKYAGTTEKTFQIGADLVRLVPEFTKYIFQIENNKSEHWVRFMRLSFNNIQLWYGNGVAVTTISQEDMKKADITSEELGESGGFANTLKSVVGWNVGMTCTEEKPGEMKISFRTRDAERFDVSKIAVALGGGGHKAAAGASIKGTLPEVLAKIKKEIGNIYPELASLAG